MTANVPAALDQQLAMREYEQQDKTYIMECRLTNEGESLKNAQGDAAGASAASGTQIRLTRTMDDSWLEAFLSLDGGDCICPESARAMLTAIRNPVYCAALYENDRIIGCGLGVVEDGKIGLYDIRVHNDFRQKGIGARICRAIMEEGRREGADTSIPSGVRCQQACCQIVSKALILKKSILTGTASDKLGGAFLYPVLFYAPIPGRHLFKLPISGNTSDKTGKEETLYVKKLSSDPFDGYRQG